MIDRRGTRRGLAAALFAWGSIARVAMADPPAPSPPPASLETTADLAPPTLVSSADVVYPEGAQGSAVVVLMLTVGRDGTVEATRAIEGDEPFASAAASASRGWKFEPARRQGQPVAARIRFEVRFYEPTEGPPGDQAGRAQAGAQAGDAATGADAVRSDREASASGPPGASATDTARTEGGTTTGGASGPGAAPAEITVVGERSAPGVSTLARAEVRQLPGAFGDPFRAIEALPGVTPIISGVPFFYLRGAPPGNIGYFLDGVRVPYLYHVGLGPSVIHPGMVERVDLHAGGYPAEYGRYAGGIVAAEVTAPRADLHGEGNLRLFDAGALAETGFAGGRGTALVAARYSFTAAVLSLLAGNAHVEYRDFEARVSYDLTPDDRLTLFTFGAYDLLGENQPNGVLNVLFGSEFYRLDTRYERRLGPSSKLRASVTLGFDRTKIPGEPRTASNTQVQARVETSHQLAPNSVLRGGVDILAEAYRADVKPYSDPDDPNTQRFNALFPPRNDLTLGAYTDLTLKYPGVTVTPGFRADVYRSGTATAVGVDPRIASRIDVTESLRILHTFGIAHQPPSFIIPIPGLAIGSLQGGLQTSLQASAGVEIDLPAQTTATVTVFDNVFLNMTDALATAQNGSDNGGLSASRSLGSAVGAEVYVRRKLTRRLGGFLSYTLSRSMRSAGTEHFPSAFDRTHVLNAALSFDLGRNWRAGARFMTYTGAPVQPPSNGFVTVPRVVNPARDPTFYRVDVRLEKRWVLSQKVWLSFVAEIMNATLSKEVLFGETIGPITIPSLGVEMGF